MDRSEEYKWLWSEPIAAKQNEAFLNYWKQVKGGTRMRVSLAVIDKDIERVYRVVTPHATNSDYIFKYFQGVAKDEIGSAESVSCFNIDFCTDPRKEERAGTSGPVSARVLQFMFVAFVSLCICLSRLIGIVVDASQKREMRRKNTWTWK